MSESPDVARSSARPDDARRDLVVARPDTDEGLLHLAVVGDTYTVLVKGEDTAGRYALIDMLVPPGGGPPPHRHDFEEMFHLLEGELQVTFRGVQSVVHAGETINVPANAPHNFANVSDAPARLLCMVSPAGLEKYFAESGDPLPSRTSPAPELDEAAFAERIEIAVALAPKYRIENLQPAGDGA